jgi:hypothetical protein
MESYLTVLYLYKCVCIYICILISILYMFMYICISKGIYICMYIHIYYIIPILYYVFLNAHFNPFKGAPEFETVVTLPRPTWKDRKDILKSMMKDCNITLESLNVPVRNDTNSDSELDIYIDGKKSTHIIVDDNYAKCEFYKNRNEEKMRENVFKEMIFNDLKNEENFLAWVVRMADLTAG